MRLICLWCALVAAASSQDIDDKFYAPQTYRQHGSEQSGLFQPTHGQWNYKMRVPNRIDSYQHGLFKPAAQVNNDVSPQPSIVESWKPAPGVNSWRPGPLPPPTPQSRPDESWTTPYRGFGTDKERSANILHHKQALTSDGSFRFEYASDNGLAAGEVIEPDGSRVGAYQYKDPNGQVVKLKYRAGKDGFQILEGSHLPKSPEPVAPPQKENHYQHAYEQQRQQYILQQHHNEERPQPHQHQRWTEPNQGVRAAGTQYFTQSLEGRGQEDDGQYRENEVEQDQNNRGPHSFGEGYAFAFQG